MKMTLHTVALDGFVHKHVDESFEDVPRDELSFQELHSHGAPDVDAEQRCELAHDCFWLCAPSWSSHACAFRSQEKEERSIVVGTTLRANVCSSVPECAS